MLDKDLDPKELDVREGEMIEDVEYVGSYKWIESEDERPTIAVPGKSPDWTLQLGPRCESDYLIAIPDIWDPPTSVGQLELDKCIPNNQEFPDCKLLYWLDTTG